MIVPAPVAPSRTLSNTLAAVTAAAESAEKPMQSTICRTPAAPAAWEIVPCTPDAAVPELFACQRGPFSARREFVLSAADSVAADANFTHSHSLSGSQRLTSLFEVSPTSIAASDKVLAVPELEIDTALTDKVLLFGPLAPVSIEATTLPSIYQ